MKQTVVVSSIRVLTQNAKDVFLFSHQTSSMKHHITETHGHDFKFHNIVLFSQRIDLFNG